MKSVSSSQAHARDTHWMRVGRSDVARKQHSWLQLQLSRKLSMLCLVLLTGLFFFMDKLLSDWVLSTSYNWPDMTWLQQLPDNAGFFFYFIGFVSAYAFLCAGRLLSRANMQCTSWKGECIERMSRSGVVTSSTQGKAAGNAGHRAPLPKKSSQPCLDTSSNLGSVMHQALAQGDAAMALDSLTKLEARGFVTDVVMYNQIIRAFAKSGDISGAERTFNLICQSDLEPNEYTYNTLMNLYAKSDDVQGVEYWMRRMSSDGITPPSHVSFAIAIHARARRGEEAEAEAWMQQMLEAGLEPQCVSYNSMIHACSVNRNVERAEEWFARMTSKGIEPTVMTYTALVDTCSKCLAVKSAEKWMQAMVDVNIRPNVVSFSTMLDACARVGDIARAELWHDKMLELEVKPNAYIYSAIINACAKACDVPAACAWLTRAESSGADLDSVVYGCVINACGKAGDSKRAMAVFKQMRKNGIRSHIVVYGALARPFAYQGEWEEVEKIAQEMEAEGIRMNDYFLYTMLLAYSRAIPRRADKAEQAFCDAMANGLRANDRIIKALSSSVGRARAAELAGILQVEQ